VEIIKRRNGTKRKVMRTKIKKKEQGEKITKKDANTENGGIQ